jgi:hypothetical protein
MNANITISDYQKKFYSKRKSDKEEFTFWIRATYWVMLFLLVSMFLYYVFILNVNATRWYSIRELENVKNELLFEKEQLDAKIADLESNDSIDNKINTKWMQKVKDPDYLVIKKWVQYVFNN